MVRRLTAGVRLTEVHGALSRETASEREARIESSRRVRNRRRRDRIRAITADSMILDTTFPIDPFGGRRRRASGNGTSTSTASAW